MKVVKRKTTPSRIFMGDKVILNSGGPEMLVVDKRENSVTCAYPLGSAIEELDFNPLCLTIVEYSQK